MYHRIQSLSFLQNLLKEGFCDLRWCRWRWSIGSRYTCRLRSRFLDLGIEEGQNVGLNALLICGGIVLGCRLLLNRRSTFPPLPLVALLLLVCFILPNMPIFFPPLLQFAFLANVNGAILLRFVVPEVYSSDTNPLLPPPFSVWITVELQISAAVRFVLAVYYFRTGFLGSI